MVVLQFRENIGGVHYDYAGVNQTQNRDFLIERTSRAGRVDHSVDVIAGLQSRERRKHQADVGRASGDD